MSASGRTTRLAEDAIRRAMSGKNVTIVCLNQTAAQQVLKLIEELADPTLFQRWGNKVRLQVAGRELCHIHTRSAEGFNWMRWEWGHGYHGTDFLVDPSVIENNFDLKKMREALHAYDGEGEWRDGDKWRKRHD